MYSHIFLIVFFVHVNLTHSVLRPKSSECSTNFPTHQSLRQSGSVILHLPHAIDDLRTGGPADFFELHHSLLEAGHATHMSAKNKHFFIANQTVTLGKLEWTRQVDEGLDPHSIVIVPEIVDPSNVVDTLEKNGGRVVKWQLGMHKGASSNLLHEKSKVALLSSTDFIHRTYLCKGLHILATSIDPIFFDIAKTRKKEKEHLVLVDDDTSIDIANLQMQLSSRLGVAVSVLQLKGYSKEETIELMTKSKVFIDLHLPGKERATHEAVMLGNCLVLGSELNGDNKLDFPFDVNADIEGHHQGNVDEYVMDDIVNSVTDSLSNYQECMRRWKPMRVKTERAKSGRASPEKVDIM